MKVVTLETLNRVNKKISGTALESLVLKDNETNAVISNINADFVKKILKDNKFYFVQYRKIRYQVYTPAKYKKY